MGHSQVRSLKSLLLGHELVLLMLVVLTGTIGGFWAHLWQQTSEQTLRLTIVNQAANRIRTDLFRQIKEVTIARLMEDEDASRLYAEYSDSIDKSFNSLHQRSVSRDESLLVQNMHTAYRVMQHDMNKISRSPYLLNRSVRLRMLDPRYEQQLVGAFEGAFRKYQDHLESLREQLELRMHDWIMLARILIPAAVAIAFALLFFSRRLLQNAFVKPMGLLTEGAHQISAGELSTRVTQQGVQEVSDLAGAMNQMAYELQQSQAALVESERQAALGSLVPVVAHNIRNPLAAIRANAQLLDGDDSADDILETRAAVIETVDRLERWVSSLVSYLHPLKPHKQETDVYSLLQAPMSLLDSRLQDKSMTVDWQCIDTPSLIMVDADLMEQVFYNLFSNAIDASPENSTVKISIEETSEGIIVQIFDEGCGMPFTPTQNDLEPGPSTKRFGTGLGIPIAYKVCKTHGWDLAFSSGVTSGTCVTITIPKNNSEVSVDV